MNALKKWLTAFTSAALIALPLMVTTTQAAAQNAAPTMAQAGDPTAAMPKPKKKKARAKPRAKAKTTAASGQAKANPTAKAKKSKKPKKAKSAQATAKKAPASKAL